ncbi:MAG: hypothetical protein KDE20_08700 [Caldilineaceae bacterium]|nr:hypothetical protein [Caldilineaceae bacterium]
MTGQTPPDFDDQRALELELEARLNMGDFDMDKMMDVVEVMWRNRDKIMDTVDNVWDNWDDIMATVDVVMRNRQAFLNVLAWAQRHSARLVDLADALPVLLHKTGDGIEAAGNSARQAGRFLAGSKDDDATSASELMDLAAHALEQCRVELDKAAELLGVLGDEIDDIRIPRLSPRFVEVMGVRVVSGVDVGEANLMDTAAKRLKGGATRLAKVGVDLETVAGKMRNLGGQLTEAGADLQSVGDQLGGSGELLRSLSLLDLGPADAEEEFEITVEIPERDFAAGTLDATRAGPALDLEPDTPAVPVKTKSTKSTSTKSASTKSASTKSASAKKPSAKKTPAKSATKASTAKKKTTTKKSPAKSTTAAKSTSTKSKSTKSKPKPAADAS